MSYQHLIWLYRYLWIAPHVLLLAVAVVMVRRKLHKQYPIFFSYLLFEFSLFCILFTMLRLKVPAAFYVKADLLDRIGCAALSFGIIQELLAVALIRLGSMRKEMTRILRWVTLGLVALGLGFIWILCYSRLNPERFSEYWIIAALRGAQCGLLLFVFLWHRILGLRLPTVSFGISLGIGLVATVDLLALALKTFLVSGNGTMVDMLNMVAYHVAVLFWLYYVQARETLTLDFRGSLSQLREEADELGRITQGLNLRRFSRPVEHAPQLIPIDLDAFLTLTDPEEERFLQVNLSPTEFRLVQRLRVRTVKTYVSAFSHNATALIAVGQSAMHHRDEEVAARGVEILQRALRLKIWCLLSHVRLNAAMVFPAVFSPSREIASPYRIVQEMALQVSDQSVA